MKFKLSTPKFFSNPKQLIKLFIVIAMLTSLSGCALIQLPFQVAGEALKLIQKMPMPPPGVF